MASDWHVSGQRLYRFPFGGDVRAVGELATLAKGATLLVFSVHGMMVNTARIDLLDGMLAHVLHGEDAARQTTRSHSHSVAAVGGGQAGAPPEAFRWTGRAPELSCILSCILWRSSSEMTNPFSEVKHGGTEQRRIEPGPEPAGSA